VTLTRPMPDPSSLTEEFWAAADRHELVRPVCGVCGASFFSPQICCPACLSEDWAYESSSGRGVVYSSTLVRRSPRPGIDAPYELAIVDLEEGWSMLANLLGGGERAAVPGTPVQVDWIAVGSRSLPAFRVGTS
jgi:uncharacterized protein